MRALITIVILFVIAGGGYWVYLKHVADGDVDGAGAIATIDTEARAATKRSAQFFEDLASKSPNGASATTDDYEAFAAAVSDIISVSYGSIDGEVARNVILTLPNNDKVGARIDELRLWGVDASALHDPQEGGARAADRIDLRGISWFGFDNLTNETIEVYTDTITESVKDIADEESSIELDLDMSFRMIVDGLTIYAPEAASAREAVADEEVDSTTQLMVLLQNYARWTRMVSIDAAAFYDMTADVAYTQMGQTSAMSFTAPVSGYKGLHRGDLEVMFVKDTSFDMKFDMPASEFADEGDEVATDAIPITIAMSGGVDVYSITDLNLAKIMSYLARGEIPPMSETDLLSFGQWRVLGERYEMNGKPFYSVKETVADLSNFHWLIPTDVRIKSDDIIYDIDGFMNWMTEIMATQPDAESAEVKVMMEKSMAILKNNDMSSVAFDMDLSGNWDPAEGEVASQFFLNFKDFGRLTYSGKGVITDYVSLKGLAPREGEAVDGEVLAASFIENSTFNKFSLIFTDDGGIEKSFALAVAFADLMPEGEPGTAMLRGADPNDLRISTSAIIRLSASQAAEAFPPAKEYIKAFADFIQKGGTLKIEAEPVTPFSFADFENLDETEDPQAIVDLLGFTVMHEVAK